MPEGANLTFTISPIDYLLKVSGTDDKELTQQIEAVLNSGKTAKSCLRTSFAAGVMTPRSLRRKHMRNIKSFGKCMR